LVLPLSCQPLRLQGSAAATFVVNCKAGAGGWCRCGQAKQLASPDVTTTLQHCCRGLSMRVYCCVAAPEQSPVVVGSASAAAPSVPGAGVVASAPVVASGAATAPSVPGVVAASAPVAPGAAAAAAPSVPVAPGVAVVASGAVAPGAAAVPSAVGAVVAGSVAPGAAVKCTTQQGRVAVGVRACTTKSCKRMTQQQVLADITGHATTSNTLNVWR
jgi:hypothetical protein